MTLPNTLIRQAAYLSRVLHSRGLLCGVASGAVRKLAGRIVTQGEHVYRDAWGHEVEADVSDYMERIGFFGAHSSRLIRYMRARLSPGDWAIDAGANVGLVSSPMAASVGPGGRVWAIEPLPRNVARLESLKARNGLVQLEVFPVALSSQASIARLRLSSLPGGSGAASFVAPWAQEDYIEVPTCRLDDLVAEQDPSLPLRLLKIDVEGFELELLAGAKQTLTMHRPLVVCEFHDRLLRGAGTSAEELVEAFASCGYEPTPPFGRPRGSLDGKVIDMLLVHESARFR